MLDIVMENKNISKLIKFFRRRIEFAWEKFVQRAGVIFPVVNNQKIEFYKHIRSCIKGF